MSWFALALLLASAMLHMGWNLLMKQAGDRYIVTWWALLTGAICLSPLLFAAWDEMQTIWGFVVASSVLQMVYYVILGFAYGSGDFSLVYPLARGTAPILIALWSTLFLGERLSWLGVLGLAAIVAGIMLIGAGAWRGRAQSGIRPTKGTVAPFLIALCISGYSVIDGAAVKRAPPLPYTVLEIGLSVILLTPMVWSRHDRGTVMTVARRQWWRIGLIGLATFAAYGLTLSAYSVAPISYVGAVREMSIVMAALAGWLWLGEPFGLTRTIGSVVVVAGILLVTVAG